MLSKPNSLSQAAKEHFVYFNDYDYLACKRTPSEYELQRAFEFTCTRLNYAKGKEAEMYEEILAEIIREAKEQGIFANILITKTQDAFAEYNNAKVLAIFMNEVPHEAFAALRKNNYQVIHNLIADESTQYRTRITLIASFISIVGGEFVKAILNSIIDFEPDFNRRYNYKENHKHAFAIMLTTFEAGEWAQILESLQPKYKDRMRQCVNYFNGEFFRNELSKAESSIEYYLDLLKPCQEKLTEKPIPAPEAPVQKNSPSRFDVAIGSIALGMVVPYILTYTAVSQVVSLSRVGAAIIFGGMASQTAGIDSLTYLPGTLGQYITGSAKWLTATFCCGAKSKEEVSKAEVEHMPSAPCSHSKPATDGTIVDHKHSHQSM